MSVYQRVCLTTVQHMFSSSYSIGRSCLSPSQQKHVKTKDTRGLMPILYHPFYGSRENCSPSKWSKGGYGFVCIYIWIYIYSYIQYILAIDTLPNARPTAVHLTHLTLIACCDLESESWRAGNTYPNGQRLLGNVSYEVFSSIHDVKERETPSWI